MKAVIDRFEAEYAICEAEDLSFIKIAIIKLPQGVKEGDSLRINGEAVYLDNNETQKRKKNIEKLAEDLWK